jgi:hypothetical protein
MPESTELLPGYTGIRGFEVVPLEGHNSFLERVKATGLYRVVHDLAYNLDNIGWTPQNAGNISARQSQYHTEFAITASGSNFADLQDDDFVCVGPIDILVGEVTLPIGANYAVNGEFNLYRIVKALADQDLLEKTKKDLGIKLKLPEEWEYELVKEGRPLIAELSLQYKDLAGPDTRDALATRYGLSPRERKALEAAFHCERAPLYLIYEDDIRLRNNKIFKSCLTLGRLVQYLGKKDLVKCRVHAIVPDGRKPSSETLLHSLIYANRWSGSSQVNSIVHCHAPRITKKEPEDIALSKISADVGGYGTLEVAVDALEEMAFDAGVLLRDHGPVVVTGDWHRMMPTEQDSVYVLDESYGKMFDKCFNHLKRLDKLSRMPPFISTIIKYVRGGGKVRPKYNMYNPPPEIVRF